MSAIIYTKKCTKCNEIKSFDEFSKNKSRKDGLNGHCKQCFVQYRNANKDKTKEYNKQYRVINNKLLKKKRKQYRKKNKKPLLEYNKQYYKKYVLYSSKFTYQLTIDEEPRLAADGVSLEVKCKYCGKYYTPTNQQISNRIQTIKGNTMGETNLYCSDGCKSNCDIFGQHIYPKGFKKDTSREVQPSLRKLVLERDNWTCQTCEATSETQPLHCHHYEGIEINPIESADMDNCITLCKKCHNKIHKDCDMRRKKCDC